jgi:H(+)-translocating pyrophosphatase
MMLYEKNDKAKESTDWLVKYYESIPENQLFLAKVLFFVSPIVFLILINILMFTYVVKFLLFASFLSILALIYAVYILIWILQNDTGTHEMQKIAGYITQGAEGYFHAQYGTIFKLSFVFALTIMLLYYTKDPSSEENSIHNLISNGAMALLTGISFMFGATCSAFSGYAGMWVSVRANIRVASAARRCYNDSMKIAFRGGYFASVINIALAILGISIVYMTFYIYLYLRGGKEEIPIEKIPLLMIGYGFGASFVAMFAQLGGGIYTKAADVGADLIGKVEAGIPEDDQRNPAVIADLVGDNVGDCAGQAADLFESITAEILSAMILGATLAHEANFKKHELVTFMLFPLTVHCLDIIASTIGMLFVHTKKGLPDYNPHYGDLEDPLDIMKRGYRVAMVIGVSGFFVICRLYLNASDSGRHDIWFKYALCGLIGVVVSYLIVLVTQYYTDYNYEPVKTIVFGSKTGAATNIIAGLAVGLESTGAPILIISVSVVSAFYTGERAGITNSKGENIGGLFGTAIATMGMFATGVYVLSMSGFGPIADNSGGIVEMSQQPQKVRVITDRLDAVGNVTKANAKGYSVATASMACFLLFSAFIDEVNFISPVKLKSVDITQPEVFIGGLLGSCTVFVFSSWSISAVGNAAQDVIKEVRRQFRENPEILEYKVEPNYKHCVEIVAKAGLREMIKPGLLSILSPIVVGYTFKLIGLYKDKELLGAKVICAFLMFATSTGILMALFFNNGGGAWDNAKKFIETGAVGGKGSEAHKAAVVGDTVGDPCKDTAGPSIHILIKLLATITLVLVPIFV